MRTLEFPRSTARTASHNLDYRTFGSGKENKEYDGIGGHLFAVMCEKSKEWGYDGIIVGEAKNTGVLKHYLDPISEGGLGAEPIGGLRFFVGEESAEELMRIYNYEWRYIEASSSSVAPTS